MGRQIQQVKKKEKLPNGLEDSLTLYSQLLLRGRNWSDQGRLWKEENFTRREENNTDRDLRTARRPEAR
jgi:hypothetical protein